MKRPSLILCALFAAILFLPSEALQAAEPGVYLLFVWGTNDPNTLKGVELSQEKIEKAFGKGDSSWDSRGIDGNLSELNPHVQRRITLSGDEATNANIVKACKELASAAGPDDAVMVYILCHGAAIKGSDGNLRHGLAPIATSADNLQMNRYGIARGTIMKAIKSKPHRLNVLITDACSATVKFEPIQDSDTHMGDHGYFVPQSDSYEPPPYIVEFLLNAEGYINVNSSRPETGAEVGELARGFAPKSSSSDGYQHAGTVFTNAFLDLAKTTNYNSDSDFTTKVFFEKLRTRLNKQYLSMIQYFKDSNQSGILSQFMQQSTQTLIRFNDDSVAFPGDLRWRPNDESSSDGFNF